MNSPIVSVLIHSVMPTHFLRFSSLHQQGRAVSVPCDQAGNVDMDSLTDRLQNAYLAARALVGREYAYPTVQPSH